MNEKPTLSKAVQSWIQALAASTGKSVEEAQRALWDSALFYGLKSGESFTKAKS